MTHAELARMAKENLAAFAQAANPGEALRKIIDSHDIVFAIYPDATSERGWDQHLIKGKPLIPGASPDELAKISTTAVPCSDLSEALAMEATFGDGRRSSH